MPRLLTCRAALIAISLLVFIPAAHASDVVISQVYGGGGNAGATYTHDFVELFNRGASAVSLNGWSIQYASATGTGNFGANSGQLTELPNVTLQPGQYYLIAQRSGTTGDPLPVPDHVDPTPIDLAAGSGKVALVTGTTSLGCNGGSTLCSAEQLDRILDLVGYGSANFFEGSKAAPALSNTTAAFRAGDGCTDTNDNAADFTAATPAPRNSSTTIPCSGSPGPPSLSIADVTLAEGDSGTTSFVFVVTLSSSAPAGGVSFDIATADDTAIAGSDYMARSLMGVTIAEGESRYEFEVLVYGDTDIEANETFFVEIENAIGATVGRARATGTITNDDFAPPVYTVVISQLYGGGGNNNAPYTHDFVELFNNGTSTVSLSGWSVQYASSTGSSWGVTPLGGSISPGQYYLVRLGGGATGSPLPAPDATGSTNMGATAGKVALVASTAALSGACPASVIDLVGYGGANCSEGPEPAAAPSNITALHRKRGGCFDSNDNKFDFTVGEPAPRNSETSTRVCEYTPTTIHQIQGSGLVTPFLGQDVSTTGIVTARKSNGFFLQTPDHAVDSDPATSEGIFVFTSSTPVTVAPGDFVTVNGTATEFFDLTQISATLPGEVTIHSSGNPLPAPIVLTTSILDPNGGLTQLERFEGMRMHADALVSVAPTNNFGETYATLAGVPRPMREPGIDATLPIPPDPVKGTVDCCIPLWDRNPERIMIDSDGLAGAPFVNVTSQVTLSNVTGPLDFAFGDYKILPETPPITSPNMAAVPVPEVPGAVRIGGFNIQNFANNETQRRKAALAIRNVMRSPEIIGHIEIRSLAALETLAAQVNADSVAHGEPDPAYEALLIPVEGSTQNLGFLVKASRVRVDSLAQAGTEETFVNPVDNQTNILHDRPPLVLHATIDPEAPSRRAVIVVLLHNRSFIDVELLEGEGPRVRAKRTAQAESVARLLQQLQTDNPATPVIALGDYNAYQFNDGHTDPLSIIKGAPTPDEELVVQGSPDLVDPDFINLTDGLPADQAYTYIFEGTPQALDHVLVNAVTQGYVKGYAIARANSDFPSVPASLFAADPTRPERSSDHDMPVAYFRFPSIAGLAVDKPVLSPPNHKMVDVHVSYTPVDRCGTTTKMLEVSSNEPVLGEGDGDTAPDWEIVDAHNVLLRAERAASGSGRVYTITVKVIDSCGLATEDQITVSVPHDLR